MEQTRPNIDNVVIALLLNALLDDLEGEADNITADDERDLATAEEFGY